MMKLSTFIFLIAICIVSCKQKPDNQNQETLQIDADCDFVKVYAHPNPDTLIHEFLERDAAGQFLQSDPWFNGAIDCPGHEPGPDSHTIISGYLVTPFLSEENEVQFTVRSEVLGFVTFVSFNQQGFFEDRKAVVDTLVVRRTPYGWRIKSPALRQFVLADSAIARGTLPESECDRIRSMIDK
ncbi:hypothetical protein L0337_00320 [candidate division KSB1 bacterium]|nr:hypothetical protein [candidate division KSB1 bacterium]